MMFRLLSRLRTRFHGPGQADLGTGRGARSDIQLRAKGAESMENVCLVFGLGWKIAVGAKEGVEAGK
jgi:hypothetical protein